MLGPDGLLTEDCAELVRRELTRLEPPRVSIFGEPTPVLDDEVTRRWLAARCKACRACEVISLPLAARPSR